MKGMNLTVKVYYRTFLICSLLWQHYVFSADLEKVLTCYTTEGDVSPKVIPSCL